MSGKIRKFAMVIIDLVLVNASLLLAFMIRFDWHLPDKTVPAYLSLILWVSVVRLMLFHAFRMYHWTFRYASIHEAVSTLKAVSIGTLMFITIVFFTQQRPNVGRSVLIIDFFICLFFISSSRFLPRLIIRFKHERFHRNVKLKRALIIGAGSVGEMVARELTEAKKRMYKPVGFIDDDPARKNSTIHGLRVLGSREEIPDIAKKYEVNEVIIAMPSAFGRVIREVSSICEKAGLKCKIIPGIGQLINGHVSIKEIRDIEIEDLLRRPVVNVDISEISSCLSGRRVLVTGAGGSIGSELCRQVSQFNPSILIVLDHDENSLFYLDNELNRGSRKTSVLVRVVIGDIRDREKMRCVFEKFSPEIVFHAAAHKHVPLMEDNPEEAVKNNILGTLNLTDIAEECKVSKFINVSTDKAVRPAGVMGASKRIAEMIISSKHNSPTSFLSVRFGNVLGSEGSVVPLFRKQIAKGGPITVTHPEATRYFMTIPEAVHLIIQAGAMGQGREIFVLDMGEPVKIVDLARDLITLSGFLPDEDIPIEFVGLRHGEKLHEEFLGEDENTTVTRHKQILVAKSDAVDREKLLSDIDVLKNFAEEGKCEEIIQKLKEIIPEYRP